MWGSPVCSILSLKDDSLMLVMSHRRRLVISFIAREIAQLLGHESFYFYLNLPLLGGGRALGCPRSCFCWSRLLFHVFGSSMPRLRWVWYIPSRRAGNSQAAGWTWAGLSDCFFPSTVLPTPMWGGRCSLWALPRMNNSPGRLLMLIIGMWPQPWVYVYPWA